MADLTKRVTDYITSGGRPEYQNATSHPSTLTVYDQPYAKQNGAEYGTFEYYKAPDGSYTRDLSKIAGVSMDDKGKITVTVPDKWKDNEQVKQYIDDTMLKTISGNYKLNENVEYQDPYDETKKIKTQEYIDKLNEAIKFQVGALDATGPTIAEAIARYGGTEEKNGALSKLSTDDIIIMNLSFKDDDSWVPLPEYMLVAYPELKDLSTFKNGFVQKNDFLENFYNIKDGKITERLAYGVATAPKKLLSEVEDMTPEQIAKTVAFGNFISGVDPERSDWDKFLQAGDALSRGFYAGFYDWFIGTADLIANVGNLSMIKGESIETRDFWNGMLGVAASTGMTSGDTMISSDGQHVDPGEYLKTSMEQMSATNKDALSKAQAGYVQGRIAGLAIDTVVSTILIGEGVNALSNKLTSAITSKGAGDVARTMAEAVDPLKATDLATEAAYSARISNAADMGKLGSALSKVASGSAKYKAFFAQTLTEAADLYTKALGGTTAMLQSLGPAELATVINAASKIATMATYANTAVGILGGLVMSAVVANKDLATKVLSGKATSDEAKSWVQKSLWDTAKYTAISAVGGVIGQWSKSTYGKWTEGTKAGAAFNEFSQKASQKVMKFTNTVSHPWVSFIKWYANNKAAAGKATSNAAAASAEAIKETVLATEMRTYGANLATEAGSYGNMILNEYLDTANVEQGATLQETLDNLARAGIVVDPTNLNLSEFQAWKADYAAVQNILSGWGDVDWEVSQVVHEFNNPDIQPYISQQISDVNSANAEILKAEKSAGLLSKQEIKDNKKLSKIEQGELSSLHSKEVSVYAVRSYEIKIIMNDAKRKGIEDLNNYKPYLEALERFTKAAKVLPKELRDIVDTEYIPALQRAEHAIVDVMMADGVYSRSLVTAMRNGGKYGKNGEDWLRLVAKKDLPKGVYNPFSKMAKEDNTISMGRFKILEDDEITWPGNGLQELLSEYGIARTEKAFKDRAKAATGTSTEIVVSSEKILAAKSINEYKDDFNQAVKQGVRSFTEDVEGTVAVGKKRTAEQKAYYDEVATTGGVQTIDIDSLRAVMRENNLPMADDIVDQESLDKFLAESTPEARKQLLDVVGDKLITPELTEEGWGEAWKNFPANIRKILRGELEKTSLQTGYGIKDTRARLNAQMPGVDVLDWSLLGREHTNGLFPGGMYAGKENPVKVYEMSVDDLAKLAGYDLDRAIPGMGEKIESNINTEGGVPVLPAHIRGSGDGVDVRLKMRWGHNADNVGNWTDYLKTLKERGIEKVPVAIDDARGSDFSSIFYQVRKTGIAQKGLDNIVEAIDKAIATGKSPEFTARDASAALHVPGWTRGRLRERIRHSIPATGEEGVASISDMEITNLLDEAEEYNWEKDEELSSLEKDDIEGIVKNKLGYAPQDITADVQQAFSEYGQIPFYRSQHAPLGSMEYNAPGGAKSPYSGAGDAYWLAPNSSYTDDYGNNKLAGTIPAKYFMSDKEKNEIFKQATKEASGLLEKRHQFMKEKFLETFKGSKNLNESWFEANWPTIILRGDKLEFEGKTFDSNKWLKKALTKKEKTKLDELSKFLWVPSGANGRFFLVEPDKVSSGDVKSYRALAEYAKKPIIDISEDGFADGTAFFYYKGIDPKFDEEVGRQLASQASLDVGAPRWDEESIAKAMEEFDGMPMDEIVESVTMGDGFGDDWISSVEAFEEGELSEEDLTEIFKGYAKGLGKKYPGISKVIQDIWDRGTVGDWDSMKFRYWDSDGITTIDEDAAKEFLSDMGEKAPSSQPEGIPEGQLNLYDAIRPASGNIPNQPQFKQPQRVSYEDYRKSLAVNSGIEEDLLTAVKDEQYNKFVEFKEKKFAQYENLKNKLDRANAQNNAAVRNSREVKIAAEEFRKNIKDFENTVLFTDKFSYMAKAPADTTLKKFVEDNNLTLPDDKRPLRSRIKHALWEKLQRGEELPAIKGVNKEKLETITNSVRGGTNRALTTEPGSVTNGDAKGQLKQRKKEFYELLDDSTLFKNTSKVDALKYELDTEKLYSDIDDAIDGMVSLVRENGKADAAIKGMMSIRQYKPSAVRYEFTVLDQVLSKSGKKNIEDIVKGLSRKIVNASIPKKQAVIQGNVTSLYEEVEKAIYARLESRLAIDKGILESQGEEIDSTTVTEILQKYQKEIGGAEADPLVIKTTNDNGEIQYERVSPAIAGIYNERPVYTPIGNWAKVFNNLALLKKINTTDLNPRSFSKQLASDSALSFVTVGALPGTLQALRDELIYTFGPDLLNAMEKTDPVRRQNIQAIAKRDDVSELEALKRNLIAKAETQIPFTLLNKEILRQASAAKYGNEAALAISRKNVLEKINSGLRKVSDKLGAPNNIRETYTRKVAGETAFVDALKAGYSLEQAEHFREHAINTATTNFRTKHAVFNALRSTTPYLTSGISGAKSFWRMFEMDPVGVSARIFTGFILPMIYFAGEIFSNDELREKYKALSESEKENHIIIAVGGELVRIPVGEELGQYTNIVLHTIEALNGENNYSFWNLMLNDLVGLIPGADWTGFTDPEVLEPIDGQTDFVTVFQNGVAKLLSSTAPPVLQSVYMANTGRDLYTGKPIDTDYVTIDEDGNAVVMSKSTSEFAQTLAKNVGGDSGVIEKVVSGLAGTTALHVLDTLTSAGTFFSTGGKEGSLTTAIDKAIKDISSPYAIYGYNAVDRRFNSAVSALYRKKESIEKDDRYIKYNQQIASEKDPERRQKMINNRNDLLTDFQNQVEGLVKGYKQAGGVLDKWKFSKVVSLLTFEDAIRANRQFMELNTDYNDARTQAMDTLSRMGIKNPDGPSSLGYIYTDNNGRPQLKMWTPTQIQIIRDSFYEQGDIHTAKIKAIIDDGSQNSLKKQLTAERSAEDKYWNKAKMTDDDYDAIDELRKEYNKKVVAALKDYVNTYGAVNVLSNDAVIDYLNDIIRVPTSYEKVKNRYVSSDNGKLNKQTGFAESYIKTIFGVKK